MLMGYSEYWYPPWGTELPGSVHQKQLPENPLQAINTLPPPPSIIERVGSFAIAIIGGYLLINYLLNKATGFEPMASPVRPLQQIVGQAPAPIKTIVQAPAKMVTGAVKQITKPLNLQGGQ